MRCWSSARWIACVAALAVCGCETETTRVGFPMVHADPARQGARLTPDQAVVTDPCAIRLHDIGGAILQYFALNKRLPDRLEDATTFADTDQPLQFTCPTSGKTYGYAPRGLVLEGRKKRIIVFDQMAAHEGQRWCVFMADDPRPGAAQSIEVLAVPEGVFRLYRPTGQ